METLSRKLATIFAADVVGYSRLMEQDESSTLAALRQLRTSYIPHLIEHHRGRLVKLLGDGFLVEFAEPQDAVDCAIAWQSGIGAQALDPPLEFRIGVHLADITIEDGDVYGNGVNIAARLESIAPPGGLCISNAVYDRVADSVSSRFGNWGPQTLKNIKQPVQVFAWPKQTANEQVGGSVWQPALDPKIIEEPVIAVLPFVDRSQNPEQAFFSEALTESLIASFAKIAGLMVIAPSSVQAYGGRDVPLRQIADDLGASFVLQGGVQQVGSRIRVTTRLADAVSAKQLWAERYDRTTDDLFALQDEITAHILTELQVTLTEGEQARAMVGHSGPVNLEALELYWDAIAKFRKFNHTDNLRSRKLVEQAIAIDGEDAKRLTLLGYTYMMDARSGWSDDRSSSIDSAADLAKRAAELDPSDGTNRSLAANAAQLRGDHDAAVAQARKAVTLEPNSADEHYVLGIMLNYAGDPASAETALAKAMRLAPLAPVGYLYQYGITQWLLWNLDAARTRFAVCAERNPTSRSSHVWLATIESEANNLSAARKALHEACRLDPSITLEGWISSEPFADDEVRQRMEAALRKAGWTRSGHFDAGRIEGSSDADFTVD